MNAQDRSLERSVARPGFKQGFSRYGVILGLVALFGLSGCDGQEDDALAFVSGGNRAASSVLPVSGRLLLRGMNRSLRKLDLDLQDLVSQQETRLDLELARVTVGLKVVAEAELGPFLEGELEGAVELRFEKLPTARPQGVL